MGEPGQVGLLLIAVGLLQFPRRPSGQPHPTNPRGAHYTDEMVDTATAQIAGEASESGIDALYVFGYIHATNRASRQFALRCGMAEASGSDDDGYSLFSMVLAVAE